MDSLAVLKLQLITFLCLTPSAWNFPQKDNQVSDIYTLVQKELSLNPQTQPSWGSTIIQKISATIKEETHYFLDDFLLFVIKNRDGFGSPSLIFRRDWLPSSSLHKDRFLLLLKKSGNRSEVSNEYQANGFFPRGSEGIEWDTVTEGNGKSGILKEVTLAIAENLSGGFDPLQYHDKARRVHRTRRKRSPDDKDDVDVLGLEDLVRPVLGSASSPTLKPKKKRSGPVIARATTIDGKATSYAVSKVGRKAVSKAHAQGKGSASANAAAVGGGNSTKNKMAISTATSKGGKVVSVSIIDEVRSSETKSEEWDGADDLRGVDDDFIEVDEESNGNGNKEEEESEEKKETQKKEESSKKETSKKDDASKKETAKKETPKKEVSKKVVTTKPEPPKAKKEAPKKPATTPAPSKRSAARMMIAKMMSPKSVPKTVPPKKRKTRSVDAEESDECEDCYTLYDRECRNLNRTFDEKSLPNPDALSEPGSPDPEIYSARISLHPSLCRINLKYFIDLNAKGRMTSRLVNFLDATHLSCNVKVVAFLQDQFDNNSVDIGENGALEILPTSKLLKNRQLLPQEFENLTAITFLNAYSQAYDRETLNPEFPMFPPNSRILVAFISEIVDSLRRTTKGHSRKITNAVITLLDTVISKLRRKLKYTLRKMHRNETRRKLISLKSFEEFEIALSMEHFVKHGFFLRLADEDSKEMLTSEDLLFKLWKHVQYFQEGRMKYSNSTLLNCLPYRFIKTSH